MKRYENMLEQHIMQRATSGRDVSTLTEKLCQVYYNPYEKNDPFTPQSVPAQ